MNQVVAKFKAIITNSCIIIKDYQTLGYKSNNQQLNIDLSTANELFHKGDYNRINIKEIEPTIQNINENIYEEDLSIIVNELINLYFKEVNEGKEERVRKQHVLEYINNFKINLKEIYNWLLNNQNDSNFIQLLGYFNYYGIEINADIQKAFKLYQKAAELENIIAQFELANMFMDGEGTDKDDEKAFKLSKKLADKGYSSGINLLGYCYDIGIGTDVDKSKAFELYLNAANLGNSIAQHNIGHMYKDGEGIEKDYNKSIEFFKKSAEKGYSDGMTMLGYCYNNGIGIDPDKKMAFKFYEKAANLENSVAQFNLALMYEYGNEIEKDMSQAIYWYKKSAKQGYQNSQNKLVKLNKKF
jgi:TPR repeat protein